jgi:hypothetical protein
MRHSGNQRFAYRCNGSHFVVTRKPPSTSAYLDRRTMEKDVRNRFFTALIALFTVAATFGDEGKFGRTTGRPRPRSDTDPMPSSIPVLSLFLMDPSVGYGWRCEVLNTNQTIDFCAQQDEWTNSLSTGSNLRRRATLKSQPVEKVSRKHLREICQRAALRRDEGQP